MKIETFAPHHLRELAEQPSQACLSVALEDPEYPKTLARFEAWSGRVDGRIVACGGIVPIWAGRAQAWMLIANDIGAGGMVGLTRTVERALRLTQHRRVEATVIAEFKPGHRWAQLLGFQRETPEPMRGFLPGGQDAVLYARVR